MTYLYLIALHCSTRRKNASGYISLLTQRVAKFGDKVDPLGSKMGLRAGSPIKI